MSDLSAKEPDKKDKKTTGAKVISGVVIKLFIVGLIVCGMRWIQNEYSESQKEKRIHKLAPNAIILSPGETASLVTLPINFHHQAAHCEINSTIPVHVKVICKTDHCYNQVINEWTEIPNEGAADRGEHGARSFPSGCEYVVTSKGTEEGQVWFDGYNLK